MVYQYSESALNEENKSILFDLQRDIANFPLSLINLSREKKCPKG